MRPVANLFPITALVLAGCTTRTEHVPYANQQEAFEPRDYSTAAVAEKVAFGRAAPAAMALQAQMATVTEDGALFPPSSVAASMIIRTGQASIEVDSLERAVSQVRALAGRIGGYVANTAMQTGRGQLRSASLEVKVPAERFEDGLGELTALGRLESANVSAQDVGEEFTDVTARMNNSRRLESRLIDLLATRTGKLKDVLDVEQELARVREQIDRYEGRLRYLRTHAALSTLTIYLHEPVPVVGHAGSSVMGEAFKQAWRNFVALAALCVRSLGIVVPLGLATLAAWLVVKRRRKAAMPA